MAEDQPFQPLEDVGIAVAAADGQPDRVIPPYTVRRRLGQHGINTRVAASKIEMAVRHKDQRLAYARRMGDRDAAYWRGVKFSDEKTFSSDSTSRVYVRRLETSIIILREADRMLFSRSPFMHPFQS